MMEIYRNGYKIIWRGKLIEKREQKKVFVAYAAKVSNASHISIIYLI